MQPAGYGCQAVRQLIACLCTAVPAGLPSASVAHWSATCMACKLLHPLLLVRQTNLVSQLSDVHGMPIPAISPSRLPTVWSIKRRCRSLPGSRCSLSRECSMRQCCRCVACEQFGIQPCFEAAKRASSPRHSRPWCYAPAMCMPQSSDLCSPTGPPEPLEPLFVPIRESHAGHVSHH